MRHYCNIFFQIGKSKSPSNLKYNTRNSTVDVCNTLAHNSLSQTITRSKIHNALNYKFVKKGLSYETSLNVSHTDTQRSQMLMCTHTPSTYLSGRRGKVQKRNMIIICFQGCSAQIEGRGWQQQPQQTLIINHCTLLCRAEGSLRIQLPPQSCKAVEKL